MNADKPEYISLEVKDGETYVVDRRVVELQPDGTRIIRDPVTQKAWKTDGTPLPDGWTWTDEIRKHNADR